VCLRNDRASVYEQDDLSLEAALVNEFRHGRATLASGEARAGAARFAQGAGRGGSFAD
jgi:enoyl-CoA hydratase